MRKFIAFLAIVFFLPVSAIAGPSFSSGGGGSISITQVADCSAVTTEGALCWDTDNDTLYIGTGAAAALVGPGAGAGTITNVWDVAAGNVNALTAAAGDSLNVASADSAVPWVVAADCSAHTADGRACWDSDDNILYIGDGATQKGLAIKGAIANADIAAGAAITFAKLENLTSGRIIVGSAGNVPTAVAMSGDVTIVASGATTIGNDKILEAHLKAVDAAADEDILTYESTTGDFEWHSMTEMLDKIGSTRGSILYKGAAAWAELTPGTAAYPLLSAGAGADPAYGQLTGAGITNNTITATQLSATLSMADGDLLDFSSVTHTGAASEGLVLPNWANVVPGADKKFLAADGSNLKLYNGGWVTIGASAAPTDATYLTLTNDATLSAERVLTEGLAIDFTDAGANGALTIAFDPTELTGNRTWAAGGAASITWTFDNSGSVDPSFTAGDGLFTFNQAVTVTGTLTANGGIVMGTGDGFTVAGVNLLSGDELDGTKIKDADYGDVTISAAGAWSVEDDSHAHTSTTITLASTNLSDTANIARLDANNTFTGTTNTVGNANTDILAVQATMRGVGRAVTIDDDTTSAPTYATGTNELFVEGDIEAGGTVYAQAFVITGAGESFIDLTSNASSPTGAGTNSLYVVGNVWKVKEGGTEKDILTPADSMTLTGATVSAAGVTSFVLPTADADAAGEISINRTNNQLIYHDGTTLIKIDTTSVADGKILKYSGANSQFQIEDDATGGTPALNQITDPTAALELDMDVAETITFNFVGDYGAGSKYLIEQKTGNPTAGVLFEVKAADTHTTVAKLGDGTNGIQVSQAGALTAIGTGTIVATGLTAGTAPVPASAGGVALGSASAEWDHLYLHDAAVIYGQADQSNTLTSAATGWTANLLFTASGGIALQNAETITNGDDTEIAFNGTESIALDLDTGTANQVQWKNKTTGSSGVTEMNFSALNMVTTGMIDGGIPVYKETSATVTVAGMSRYYVNADDDVIAFNLPADPTNKAYCFANLLYARAITINPDDADYIVNGDDTLAAGEALISSGAKKDQVCVVGIDTGYWKVTSTIGTWAQETP